MHVPIVASLLRAPAEHDEICRAVAGTAKVVHCREPSQLWKLLRIHDPAIVVAGASIARWHPPAPLVAYIRRQHPSVPIVAYCSVTPAGCLAAASLARAGADHVLLIGIDDVGSAIWKIIGDPLMNAFEHAVLEALDDQVTPYALAMIKACLRAARDGSTVASVAVQLGITRKTLWQRTVASFHTTPRGVLTWCRLLRAVSVLDSPRHSVEGAALLCGFSSGSALGSCLRRHAGVGPGELRARGGFAHLLDRFRDIVGQRAHAVGSSPA